MEKLIPLVNRIQDALGRFENQEGISFPRLVVVGSQSSGKSSVLESLVGRDFLPRGSGIVTRRPLILQLEHRPEPADVGIFDHKPGVNYKDFTEIRKEIERETERLVGKKFCISGDPIKLKIFSRNVVDITLIDLPGMTKVPTGDQPHDISEQIRNMILEYIKDSNSIILAISPANQDIANSDALKIAHEVDPNGERTIGVITKIDIMDKGTDAVEVLSGRLYPLSLGYIGVICRNQEDILNGKKIQQHFEDEKNFFVRNEKYKHIAHKMGTAYLAVTLNVLLKNHIIKTLPTLKKKINEMIRNCDLELKTYGMPLDGNKDFQGIVVLNIITTFCNMYTRIIEGRNSDSSSFELNGGAQIRHILFTKYMKTINEIDLFSGLSEQDIRTAILNSRGIRSSYLIPQEALEILIKFQIKKLLDPSLTVSNEILEILKKFVRMIEIPEFRIFSNLQPMLLHIVDNVLDNCNKPAGRFIMDCIENELAFINLDHPSLISIERALQDSELEFESKKKALALETANQVKS